MAKTMNELIRGAVGRGPAEPDEQDATTVIGDVIAGLREALPQLGDEEREQLRAGIDAEFEAV